METQACGCEGGCNINDKSMAMEILKEQHEMNKKEHTSKTITIILLIILLAGTNATWLYKWSQCDHRTNKTTTVIADNDSNAIIGGEVNIGD